MADIQTQLPVKLTDGTNTAAVTGGSALRVDGSSVTQPVSGTITNVPSGTQPVSGTITAVPSGTQAVSGTITVASGTVTTVPSGTESVQGTWTAGQAATGASILAVQGVSGGVGVLTIPSGTQTVEGTITAVPSGTQAVSGTITNVPSGTQAIDGTVTLASGTVTLSSQTVTVASGTVTTVPTGTQTVTGSLTISPGGEVSTGIVAYYQTQTDVANASTGTIAYTVTSAKTLFLKQILASSSGAPCKVIVNYGAGPTDVAVGFYATSSPFLDINFAQPISIAADSVVRVIIMNNCGTTQDVYGFIGGHEV